MICGWQKVYIAETESIIIVAIKALNGS